METQIQADLTLAILAGGKSVRFGRDKCAAMYRGKQLIRHVYDAARQLVQHVVISAGSGSYRPDLPNTRIVRDVYPDAGPLAGIHACMKTASTPWILVIACDLPNIQTRTLENVISKCESPNQVVLCQTESGIAQPLCAAYHTSIVDRLEAEIRSERFGVQRFVNALEHVVRINVSEEEMTNVNTPDDLRDHHSMPEPKK